MIDLGNLLKNAFGNFTSVYSNWDSYHKNGIIPNLWAGFTGQKSAEMQTEANIKASQEQYDKENQWQRDKYESELSWQREQFGSQMDFANRQLDANLDVANKNLDLQQNAFDYQKQLNATQMEREDNAIQRQVADYAAAGFSPLAAIGGSGSSASPLSAGSAPQMDYSGVNAAAGQYADFARQYASLHNQATQNYMNNRSAAARAHNSDILGARMALSQMKSDMYYKNQNMATQYFNAAVNAKGQLLNNDYLREQISNLQDQHKYNVDHGYRSVSPVQALTDAILQYIDRKKDKGDTTLEGAAKVTKEVAQTVRDNLQKIPEELQVKIAESNLEDYQKIALTAYTEYLFHPVKSLKEAFSNLFEDGKELYNRYLKRGK